MGEPWGASYTSIIELHGGCQQMSIREPNYSQVYSHISSRDLGHALGVDQHISHSPVLQAMEEASISVV